MHSLERVRECQAKAGRGVTGVVSVEGTGMNGIRTALADSDHGVYIVYCTGNVFITGFQTLRFGDRNSIEVAKKRPSLLEVNIEEIECRIVENVVENLKCLLLGVFAEVFIS